MGANKYLHIPFLLMPTPAGQLQNANKSAEVLRVIAHPIRLSIVELLSQPGAKERNVTDIINALEQPQAIVSQHLILLKDRGILTSKKVGTKCYYQPAVKGLAEVVRAVLVLTQ